MIKKYLIASIIALTSLTLIGCTKIPSTKSNTIFEINDSDLETPPHFSMPPISESSNSDKQDTIQK